MHIGFAQQNGRPAIEKPYGPQCRDKLRNDGSNGRAFYAQLKDKDKQRIQHDVGNGA